MNSELETQLVAASLKNEAGREEFLHLMTHAPLNKHHFEAVWACAMTTIAKTWVVDGYAPELLNILSSPQGWDDWSETFPFLDELLLATSSDPRVFECLAFRWMSSDGRPEGGERLAARSADERKLFFTEIWKAVLSVENTTRLEQMLCHPIWRHHLTDNEVCFSLWAPLKVWRILHTHNVDLPLRRFWQAAMTSLNTSDKLHFLMTEVDSSALFIAQQYADFWRPVPDEVALVLHSIVKNIGDVKVVSTLHKRVVERAFTPNSSAFQDNTADEIVSALRRTPLFDTQLFVHALAGNTSVALNAHMMMVVDTLIQQLEGSVQQRLIAPYATHPVLGQCASVQRYRIADRIDTRGSSERLKKI